MRLPRPGLLAKTFLLQAAVLALAALLLPVLLHLLLEDRAAFYEHKVLDGRARAIADALYATQDNGLRLLPGRFDREGERGEFGYAVADAAGAVLLASTPFAAEVLGPSARGPAPLHAEIAFNGRRYAVASLPVPVADRGLRVVVGWDLDADDVIFDDVLRDVLPLALAATVPLLLLLLGLDGLVIRRFFRPVLRAAAAVKALDPVRLDARLPSRNLPPEVLPLAEAFNTALDRVEQAARLQKEFTADAAHELRTPLAVLDARLQTLPASALQEELLGDTRRMARIVGQLLDLARLEQPDAPDENTDLLAVCRAVVGDLAPEAIGRGQELGLAVPDGLRSMPVRAREQDAWHMLRNLVENAIRHTPPGTEIEVRLEPPGGLVVRDNGPGIPEELHGHVFRRFWRSRRNNGSGAGLGLSIVQRVAQARGGSVVLRSAPGQGTAFVIQLPPAAATLPASSGGAGPAPRPG